MNISSLRENKIYAAELQKNSLHKRSLDVRAKDGKSKEVLYD